MNRRQFLKSFSAATAGLAFVPPNAMSAETNGQDAQTGTVESEVPKDWLSRWEQSILQGAGRRYCDTESGEELGWVLSPFLEGFYYGFKATNDLKWVRHLVDWGDSWLRRGVREPDDFIGWPKLGTGGRAVEELLTDSLLGEAMAFRPLILMAGDIQKSRELKKRFGSQAESWLKAAQRMYEKWDSRGCWREIKEGGGGVWVVPPFGLHARMKEWTRGYAARKEEGFSNPANKQNHIARWLLALHDVTQKSVYRERAEKWFRRMKSNLRTREDGKFAVWNYWEPAGKWDYEPDGKTPRHWVGVHPNGGYYAIDVAGMVDAFEHGLVFTREDIQLLAATNRDYMWDGRMEGATFRRIDGGPMDQRWEDSPGVLWTSLVPYDPTLRKIFLANHKPGSWGGLATTPWFVARETGKLASMGRMPGK